MHYDSEFGSDSRTRFESRSNIMTMKRQDLMQFFCFWKFELKLSGFGNETGIGAGTGVGTRTLLYLLLGESYQVRHVGW
jgi:hypothetical protein